MSRTHPSLKILLLVGMMLALYVSANAASRTYVASFGDDTDPCSRSAPCRTFSAAYALTTASGEIQILDPGGYGSLTISKAITINGNSTNGSIVSNGVAVAITVQAGLGDVVTLRGLEINGNGTGSTGVRVLSAKTVKIDRCWFVNLASHGIDVAATDNVNLMVNDTIIEKCGGDGLRLSTTTGQVVAVVDNTRVLGCASDGVEVIDRVRLGLRNSIVSDNTSVGVKASGFDSQLNLDHVFIAYSSTGIQGSANSSTIRVSDSVIKQNATGLNANGGAIESFQGNSLMGNGVAGAFTGLTTNKQ